MVRLIDADALNTYDVSPAYGMTVIGLTEEDIELAPTIDAIPVEFIEAEIKRMEYEIEHALIKYKHADGTVERMIARKAALEFTLAKWRAENGNADKG